MTTQTFHPKQVSGKKTIKNYLQQKRLLKNTKFKKTKQDQEETVMKAKWDYKTYKVFLVIMYE